MKISSAGPVQLQSFTKAQSPAALQKRASSDRSISLPAPLDRPINQPAPGDITTSAVSVEGAEGENYWTAERMRDAQPLPLPTIPFLLTGLDRPISLPVPLDRPINQPVPDDTTGVVSAEVPEGENYWTAERMRDAQPLPLPTIPFPLGVTPVPYDTQSSLGSQRLKRTA